MWVPRADGRRAFLLLAGLAAGVALRAALAGPAVAASVPAGLAFAAVLGAVCVAAGMRLSRPRLGDVGIGLAGAVVLIVPWLLAPRGIAPVIVQPSVALAWWTPAVVAVAVAEEALLRGALFSAALRRRGPGAALALTTVAFALMHLPLYGAGALPVDAAVGLLLGGLRLLTGGWTASAVAHGLADVAGGWL